MAYHTELLAFARKLTGIFALALGMDEHYFDEYIRHPEAGMRIIHYPVQDTSPEEQNGIGTSLPPLPSTQSPLSHSHYNPPSPSGPPC